MLNNGFIPQLIIPYLPLLDTFTTALTAGNLFNTVSDGSATDRVVTDTTNLLSISGGKLVTPLGPPGSGNPKVVYDPMPRLPGMMVICEHTNTVTGGSGRVGWNSSPTGFGSDAFLMSSGTILITISSSQQGTIGPIAANISHRLCVIMRASGFYFFVKGGVFTNWTFVWSTTTNTSNILYPTISAVGGGGSYTNDYIKTSYTLWLPTPLLSDGFSLLYKSDGFGHNEGITNLLGSGGDNVIWVPNTNYAVSALSLSLGSNLFSNSTFANTSAWVRGSEWSISGGRAVAVAGNLQTITQSVLNTNRWYEMTFDVVSIANGWFSAFMGSSPIGPIITQTGSYVVVGRADSGSDGGIIKDNVVSGSIDNLQVKQIALESMLISPTTYSSTNYVIETGFTLKNLGSPAGIACQIDNIANVQNGVFVYYDYTTGTIRVEKLVSGSYTTVSAITKTYVAGAKLIVKKSGNVYLVFYNGSIVGTPLTISDASIASGTYHALFSGSALNTFSTFNIGNYTTWTSNGATIFNTPSVGSDIISNGGFASDTVWSKGAGWTIASGVATATATAAGSNIVQSTATIGVWYQHTFTITAFTAGSITSRYGAGTQAGPSRTAVGTYTDTNRQVSTTEAGLRTASGSNTLSIDNVIVKPLTLSELIRAVNLNKVDVHAITQIPTYNTSSQCGIITALDSSSSPQNFILVYLDNATIKIDKCVGGTYTNLASAAFTYSSTAYLRVFVRIESGALKIRVFYGTGNIGSEVTVSDVGIVSNTLHGLFSTSEINQMDNLVIFSSGSGNEYSALSVIDEP